MRPIRTKTIYIYGLLDPITNQIRYVGKSKNIKARMKDHLFDKRPKNAHKVNWVSKLQNMNLNPECIILDVTSEKDWIYCEIWWIEYFKFLGCNLLNISKGGDDNSKSGINHAMYGKKHTNETRNKMSLAHTKRPKLTEETRRKLVLARSKQKPISEETKLKISNSLKGKIKAPLSEETRIKMSESAKGRIFSQEHIKNMSDSQKGKVINSETRLKISESNKGLKRSEETRNRMSESAKKRHANRNHPCYK